MLAAGACNLSAGGGTTATSGLVVTGLVVAADGPGAGEVNRFTLRTEDGRLIDFVVGTLSLEAGGLPAVHLREHLLSNEQVTVEYEVRAGANVALRYTDASE